MEKSLHDDQRRSRDGAGVTKERINPASVFRSLDHGFSQAVVASGRKTLYVSGQTAWDAQKRLMGGSDLESQARQAFLRHFFSGEAKPASTWVGVSALADPGFLIEVEATAVLD